MDEKDKPDSKQGLIILQLLELISELDFAVQQVAAVDFVLWERSWLPWNVIH